MTGKIFFEIDLYEIRERGNLSITNPANNFPCPNKPYALLRKASIEWEHVDKYKDPYDAILGAIGKSEKSDRMIRIADSSDLTDTEQITLRMIEDDYNIQVIMKQIKSSNRPDINNV